MWTLFWDMHSGGGTKEEPYEKIYIELPEEEACVYFYNRFGHNPNRVTCTCCGEDYSIDSNESLKQLSGFHRGARRTKTKRDPVTGLYLNDDPNGGRYLDPDEAPPEGYEVKDGWNFMSKGYLSLEEYEKRSDVLIIRSNEIDRSLVSGTVPEQGYVWVGD